MPDPTKPERAKGVLSYRSPHGYGKIKGSGGGWWHVPAVEFPVELNLRLRDVVTFDAYPAQGHNQQPVARNLRLFKRGVRKHVTN